MDFPKWVSRGYGMGEILCLTAEDEAAVNAERDEREGVVEVPDESVDSVRAKLDDLGIKYDRRLGLDKLKALLPE